MRGDLELKSLKYLSVDSISKCEFNLNCPNLVALCLDGEVETNLIADHSFIRTLERPTILKSFSNYQQLSSLTIYKINDTDLSWLSDLRNLEELHIYSIKHHESLERLKEMKYELNLNNLRIRFGGIDIENEDLFSGLCSVFRYLFSGSNTIWSTNFLTNRLLRFYTRNNNQLVDLRFVEYLELEENFDLPSVIISKLFNLKTLYANNQCFNDDKFTILIQNCRKIKHLQFSNLNLDQSQYNLIPIYLTNLRTFELKRCNPTSLEFVKFIKNIEFFACTTEFSLTELKSIILNCRLLRIIKLKYEYDTFFIRLINLNFKYLEQIYQFDTFDDLIQHIDSCSSFKELVCRLF